MPWVPPGRVSHSPQGYANMDDSLFLLKEACERSINVLVNSEELSATGARNKYQVYMKSVALDRVVEEVNSLMREQELFDVDEYW